MHLFVGAHLDCSAISANRWVVLLWTQAHKCFFNILPPILLIVYTEGELYNVVILFLKAKILSSTMAEPLYISKGSKGNLYISSTNHRGKNIWGSENLNAPKYPSRWKSTFYILFMLWTTPLQLRWNLDYMYQHRKVAM